MELVITDDDSAIVICEDFSPMHRLIEPANKGCLSLYSKNESLKFSLNHGHNYNKLTIYKRNLRNIIKVCERIKNMDKDKNSLTSYIRDINIQGCSESFCSFLQSNTFEYDELETKDYKTVIRGFQGDYQDLENITSKVNQPYNMYIDFELPETF